MPSGRVAAATTTEAIQEIEVYKATLALENMPGKQTLIAGTRIRHLPIWFRRAILKNRSTHDAERGRVPEERIQATRNRSAESKRIKY